MGQQCENQNEFVSNLTFNYKRAITQMLLLQILSQRECYILEIINIIRETSRGVVDIGYPYGALSRMQDEGYIIELPKRKAPDGRLRQYYGITSKGRNLLQQQLRTFNSFSSAVSRILDNPIDAAAVGNK